MKQKMLLLLGALLILTGCAPANETEPAETRETGPVQKLVLSVAEGEENGYTYIPREELGTGTGLELSYGQFREASIQLEGTEVPLPQAIREKGLTLADILSYARQDTENGFCQESVSSEHGVATYSYAYPAYCLDVVLDLYEMPNGELQQIEELHIYKPIQGQHSRSRFFVDEDSKWGYFADREDWGLTFAVTQATPSAVTIACTQQGGQQIGQLQIFDYLLYPAQDYDNPEKRPGYLEKRSPQADALPIPVRMEGDSQFTIDWSEAIGPVGPGEYYLKLSIEDIYEESDVHPLMENYYDKQGYYIEFTLEP